MPSSIGQAFASFLGIIATVTSVVQYFPQLVYNFQRKSTAGLSANSFILKLVGSSFLLFSSFFMKEAAPIVLYGLGNIITHVVFMMQFHFYRTKEDPSLVDDAEKKLRDPSPSSTWRAWVQENKYLLWVLFPFFPLFLDVLFPSVIRLFLFLSSFRRFSHSVACC